MWFFFSLSPLTVCEYYAHWDCQEFVTSNCKNCSNYGTDFVAVSRNHAVSCILILLSLFWLSAHWTSTFLQPQCSNAGSEATTDAAGPASPLPPQLHHWREGNLSSNSKCTVCRKSCWSSDCLTGFRCEWCGLTVSMTVLFSKGGGGGDRFCDRSLCNLTDRLLCRALSIGAPRLLRLAAVGVLLRSLAADHAAVSVSLHTAHQHSNGKEFGWALTEFCACWSYVKWALWLTFRKIHTVTPGHLL